MNVEVFSLCVLKQKQTLHCMAFYFRCCKYVYSFFYLQWRLSMPECCIKTALQSFCKCFKSDWHIGVCIHNLHTLAHNWRKWHGAKKRCRWRRSSRRKLCMCEQTIHTNKKLKFLIRRKARYISVRASVCGTMCWHVSFLLYLNNSAERYRLRQLNEFHFSRYWVSIRSQKY